MSRLLSKTDFLKFLNCPKELSLDVFHKELNNDEVDVYILGRKESLMKHSDEYMTSNYGEIYEVRFNKDSNYSEMIKETQDLLNKESCEVIKNYTSIKDDCIVIIDYVVKDEDAEGGLILFEVLNSKSIKKEDLKDIGFQSLISSIQNTKALYFSDSYIKPLSSDLDIDKLFHEKLIIQEADNLNDIANEIKEAKETLNKDIKDENYINANCFECSFKNHCLKNEKIDEDYTVYSVPHDKSLKWECLSQDIRKIDDIKFNDVKWVDNTFFGERNPLLFDNEETYGGMSPSEIALEKGTIPKSQEHHKRLYLESVRFNRPIVHKPSLKNLLGGLVFPIHFFDYEAYQQHIPSAYGEAYEQQVFQWGNHKLQEDGTLTHNQWIVDINDGHKKDNRTKLVDSLIQEFRNDKGSIIAHYTHYERGRNNDLINFLQEPYYQEHSDKFKMIERLALVGIPLTGIKGSSKKIPFVTNEKALKKYIEENTFFDEEKIALDFFGIGSRSFAKRFPLVMNEATEIISIMNFFRKLFNEDKKIQAIRDINSRLFEEMDFFKFYYEKDFRGSISIKQIQKVLFGSDDFSHLHYSKQDIKNGGELMHLFDNWDSLSSSERETMFKNVLSYNKIDTLLMVEIYKFFIGLVND